MKKKILGIIILVIMAFITVFLLNNRLPQITLPEAMHHNTIGELPFVEVMDDGNFYEVDGAEEIARKEKAKALNFIISMEYADCIRKVENKCKNGITCYRKYKNECDEKYIKEMNKHFNIVSPYTSFFIFREPPDVINGRGWSSGSYPISLKGGGLK